MHYVFHTASGFQVRNTCQQMKCDVGVIQQIEETFTYIEIKKKALRKKIELWQKKTTMWLCDIKNSDQHSHR